MKVKFDSELIRSISFIQSVTRTSVKDCIEEDNTLVVIVPQEDVSKAIGKAGQNVKKLEQSLKRKIKIVGFNPNHIQFIKNLIFPLKISDAIDEEGTITLVPVDSRNRGYLIGRNGCKLRWLESVVKRYFPIKSIKVSK
ncbi:MAG: NusA-like transcription termination signal-binding factor [Candidatus Woesearchaeota archaeon]